MKIQTLIAATCLAVSAGTATAQTGKLELGVQGGPSVISLRGNDVIAANHDPALGFSAGLFAQYNLSESLSFRIDPAFERKGSMARAVAFDENGNQVAEFTMHQNFDYITLPLLVRATFGKKHKFFANAGPYAALVVSASQIARGEDLPDGFFQTQPFYYTDFDFGITAGAGFLAPLTERINLSVELRNNLGLKDISQSPVVNSGTVKTNATNLLVGVAYKM